MLVNLLDYVQIISGGTPKTKILEYWNGNIPWLAIDDFRNVTKYVYKAQKSITEKGLNNSSTEILENNDIIISSRGTVGKIALIYRDMAFNQSCFGIRVNNKKDLNPEYLFYYLKCNVNSILKKKQGAIFDSINLDTFKYIRINLPCIQIQNKIVSILSSIDNQIERNNSMVKKLQVLGKAIFKRFFSKEKQVVSLLDFPYISILKPGIKRFDYRKKYIATADVEGNNMSFNVPEIDYASRESRANMQPIKSSIWFAKMKKSIKHIFISQVDDYMVNQCIFSTGFCGIKCDDIVFEYIVNFIDLPYFELIKDKLAHGATQEAVNNDDLKSIKIQLPSRERLLDFHNKTKGIYRQISRIKLENYYLNTVKEKLLPLLMNGQLQ